ncbi:MAG: mechanosensitive ion channel family protein [Campylobacterota bacterium]|nr:mechanosensitive ion channel family protein [Campylobacterota bacterium]
MIKHIFIPLFLILSFFQTSLSGEDLIGDFVAKQMDIERQFLDQNISSDRVEKLIKEQDYEYKTFFLLLISKESKKFQNRAIYANEMSMLQRRMKVNKQHNNTKAYMRDEIKFNTYTLLNNIRHTLYAVSKAAQSDTEKEFIETIDKIVATRHADEQIISKEDYPTLEQEDNSEFGKSIRENFLENQEVLNVHAMLSAELLRFKSPMYDAIKLSSFGLISFGYKINTSNIGEKLNEYLQWSGLDSAKIIFIFLFLFGFYLARKLLVIVSGTLLQNFFDKSDDVSYIIKSVSGVFSVIMVVVTIDVIVKIYAGFMDASWIGKAFDISYTILATYLIQRLINAAATLKIEQLRRSQYLRHEVINLAMRVLNIVIYIIGIIIILNLFDVNLSAILSGLGIGGFAVAFAAKDTIANFFGSVSILMGDLFEQGDWIAVDGYEGTVVEIGLRATTIRTFDNAMIAIPNFKLVDNGLRNWSKRQLGRRIKMHIGVTYESDFNDIKHAIDEIREMLIEHKGIANNTQEMLHAERYARLVSREDYKGIKRTMLVYMDRFSDSSIDILVYCYSKSVIWNEWLEIKEDVMYKIAEILEKNSLSFAYPAMALHNVETKSDDVL